MDNSSPANEQLLSPTPFLGVAPFLRANISGVDLRPLAQETLAQAERYQTDPELWMNLSVALQCIGQRDIGLVVQDQALSMKRTYRLAATIQPAQFRLLVLFVPGDIAANTPIDCLMEDSDVDLIFYYVSAKEPFEEAIPEHDALLVGISDSDENRVTLKALERALEKWPKPIINAPQYIQNTGRDAASRLLHNIPGLLIPPTLRATRAELDDIATGQMQLAERFPECPFPIIVRPLDSQAGRDLDRINNPQEMAAYLAKVDDSDFYISRFIDYSGKDGLYRKFRIALIDGKAFACHMAISSNWMVHYVNAGMYEDAQKREEEAAFMQHFEGFAQRHQAALSAVHLRTKLDYVCLDCAETPDGQLLVFEIDHVMVVHAMDPYQLFPYKQFHMQKVIDAFRGYLSHISTNRQSTEK